MNQNISRRRFIRRAGGALAATGLTGLLPGTQAAIAAKKKPTVKPKPAKTNIQHIVVVMMENRSFDHFLGWLPGADVRQEGLVYTDRAGQPHPTWHLAPDYQGCG